MNRWRGFSLIELTIALAILSVLLAAVATTVVRQVEQRRVSEADRQLELIREALIGYAIAHRRLPRPAISANDGRERATDCATEVECTGFIAWAALGMPQLDPWGKIYRYTVTRELANATSTITIGSVGRKEVYASSAQTNATGDVATNVAAVVWSHGARHYGTSDSGTTVANTSTTNRDEQANNTATFASGGAGQRLVARQPTDNVAYADRNGQVVGEFDDRLVWLATPSLIAKMVQAGRIP
jgi:prepilin-type N-terminal cleavage/methylation domain-containing protein